MPLNFNLPSESPNYIKDIVFSWKEFIFSRVDKSNRLKERLLFLLTSKLVIQEKLSNLGDLQLVEKLPAVEDGTLKIVDTYIKLNKYQQLEFKEHCNNLLNLIDINIEIIRLDILRSPTRKVKKKTSDEELFTLYIECCKINKTTKPTLELLTKHSGKKIKKDKWRRKLTNIVFYAGLITELNKKINQAKKDETKYFWIETLKNYEDFYGVRVQKRYDNKNSQEFNEELHSQDTIVLLA